MKYNIWDKKKYKLYSLEQKSAVGTLFNVTVEDRYRENCNNKETPLRKGRFCTGIKENTLKARPHPTCTSFQLVEVKGLRVLLQENNSILKLSLLIQFKRTRVSI